MKMLTKKGLLTSEAYKIIMNRYPGQGDAPRPDNLEYRNDWVSLRLEGWGRCYHHRLGRDKKWHSLRDRIVEICLYFGMEFHSIQRLRNRPHGVDSIYVVYKTTQRFMDAVFAYEKANKINRFKGE